MIITNNDKNSINAVLIYIQKELEGLKSEVQKLKKQIEDKQ